MKRQTMIETAAVLLKYAIGWRRQAIVARMAGAQAAADHYMERADANLRMAKAFMVDAHMEHDVLHFRRAAK